MITHDLERENRRLREELEYERDRRERLEAAELKRDRDREADRSRWRPAHPSNRLYNGLISDPEEAIETHLACLRIEDQGWDTEQQAAEWRLYIAVAEACLQEYRDRVKTARQAAEARLFAEWARSEDTTRKAIGECGLSGDWSGLAI